MPQAKWEKRLVQCEAVLELLSDLPEQGEDFALSASETVESIARWIETHEDVTPRQCEALDNIQQGAEAWRQ